MIKMNKILKYFSSTAGINFVRFLRVFPNNDPIMSCMLPFAKKDSWWKPFLFVVFTMASFDFIVNKVGLWTIGTSLVYGLIALLFYFVFKRLKNVTLRTYLFSGTAGILIFDFLTGPIMSSYLFKMPFSVALLGQIPFTAMHLFSGLAYIFLLVPVLDEDVNQEYNLWKWMSKILKKITIKDISKNVIKARNFIFLALVVFSLLITSCISQTTDFNRDIQGTVKCHFEIIQRSGSINYKDLDVEKGANAFELMKKNFVLDYDEYPMGVFVKSIDNYKPEEDEYWALYVNGEYAEKGISQYIINEDINITWKIEKINYSFG